MKNFYIRNSSGNIIRTGQCSSDTFSLQAQDGETVHEGIPDVKQTNTPLMGTGYAAQRYYAYPSMREQLDTIYHKGMDAWKAEIQAVKDKYPKV